MIKYGSGGFVKSREECQIFFEKISEFIDGELDADKKEQLLKHIKDCKPCLKYIDSLKKIKECLKIEKETDSEIEELTKESIKKILSKKNNV